LTRHCERREVLGIAGRDGAFAERLSVPLENLHRVPEAISDQEAVFVEPLAAALGVLEAGMRPGDAVLVVGDGRLGALIALGLGSRGVRVELTGRHPEKLSLLRSLGVPIVSGAPAPAYPWVVEATGSPGGVEAARAWVKPRGTMVLKSTGHQTSPVALSKIVVDELRLVGSRCGDFPPALEALASRAVDVRPLVSAVYPLERWPEAFEAARGSGAFKVLLNTRETIEQA
jgi:threonine dehydrogenase-like Zn-dependent dehydrogenase